MLPEAANASNLLYVSNSGNGTVTAYAYKAGTKLKLVGALKVPGPTGVCSDKSGNVWIGSKDGHALHEYPHGATKPVQLIRLPGSGQPAGCAVDSTGNLAVAVNHPHAKAVGHFAAVLVYAHGSGFPEEYETPGGFFAIYFVAFDGSGNLFADATLCDSDSYCYSAAGPPGLFELKRGDDAFSELTLQGFSLNQPTGLAWINPTLLINDRIDESTNTWVADKVLITNGKATLVQTLSLSKMYGASGVAVRAGVAIVADIDGRAVRTYSISDGSPLAVLNKSLSSPYAVTVSQGRQ
jgi:DNA-binding beta-propeller fold protein YncE